MLYLISYDLRAGSTVTDYARINSAIEALGGRRVLLSQWAVRSPSSSTQLSTHLREFIDDNDRLLVTEIKSTNLWSHNLRLDLSCFSQYSDLEPKH
jgi:hypothetical protein